jgi:nicotinamidase-related amidase
MQNSSVTSALIVVDVQSGTLGNLTPDVKAQVVERAAALVAAFRARSLPVVIATIMGSPRGRTDVGTPSDVWPAEMTELPPAISTDSADIRITRRASSASRTLRSMGSCVTGASIGA